MPKQRHKTRDLREYAAILTCLPRLVPPTSRRIKATAIRHLPSLKRRMASSRSPSKFAEVLVFYESQAYPVLGLDPDLVITSLQFLVGAVDSWTLRNR